MAEETEKGVGTVDLSNVHRRIDEHSDQLAKMATLQAKTDTQLLSLTQSVAKGFADSRLEYRETRAELRTIAEKMQPSPTNWPAAIGIAVTGITTAAGFLWATLAPIKEANHRQDSEQMLFLQRLDDMGSKMHQYRIDDMLAQLKAADEERETWKAISRLEGRQELTIKRQDNIDSFGSRLRRHEK